MIPSFRLPNNYAEMRYFVKIEHPSEDVDFEYKSVFPQEAKNRSSDLSNSGMLSIFRKTFCAFANSRGGYLIVGVAERSVKNVQKYTVTGSSVNKEIHKVVSDIIKNKIKPAISVTISSIKIPGRKYVHFIKIPPSPSFKKPHMFDNSIYIRDPGQSRPIEGDGQVIRELIEADYFSPLTGDAYFKFLEAAYKFNWELPPFYQRYFFNLGRYIYANAGNNQILTKKYNEIHKIIYTDKNKIIPIGSGITEGGTSYQESHSALTYNIRLKELLYELNSLLWSEL